MHEGWDWLPLAEAAQRLGVTETALTKRRQRGTWDTRQDASGQYLYRVPQQEGGATQADSQADTAIYRELIALLQEQLAEERAARQRADAIIMQLTIRVPAPELKPIALPESSSQQADSGVPSSRLRRWWDELRNG